MSAAFTAHGSYGQRWSLHPRLGPFGPRCSVPQFRTQVPGHFHVPLPSVCETYVVCGLCAESSTPVVFGSETASSLNEEAHSNVLQG